MKMLPYRPVVRLLVFTSVSALLLTCKQEGPLPYATQTGQNTFGCMINGKPYVPDGGGGWSGIKPLQGGFYKDYNNTRHIWITTLNSKQESIHLYIDKPTVGEHLLNKNTGYLPAYFNLENYGYYQASNGHLYLTSARSTGKVTVIKADTVTGLLSGTFPFKATNKDGATVDITAGRFDMISPQ